MNRTDGFLVALAAAIGVPAGLLIAGLAPAVGVALLTLNVILFTIHRETRNRVR